jgi:hypothetical protein
MADALRGKNCFIIGPMSGEDESRLPKLKAAVTPLLERLGYTSVRNPFDLVERDRVMNGVIAAIDRADLVIADLTRHNPNVFYELAICHSLGVPTVLVREETEDITHTPFDIRDFVYIEIEVDKPAEVRDRLADKLTEVDRQIEERIVFENPVTIYYREPITNISPAAGLAQGYYHNFVKPTVERIKWMNPDQTEHIYNIEVYEGTDTSKKLATIGKSLDVRADLKLNIVIPDKLEFCTEDRISAVKRTAKQGVIQYERRSFTVMARQHQQGYQFIDIPSAMNVITQSINRRAGQLKVRKDSVEWRDIERDEVNRFHMELKQWVDENDFEFKRRVRIWRYNHDHVSDDLLWLRNIWTES